MSGSGWEFQCPINNRTEEMRGPLQPFTVGDRLHTLEWLSGGFANTVLDYWNYCNYSRQ